MRGLKIIVLTPDAERFRGALTMAASHAALGYNAALLLQLDAVKLLQQPMLAPLDAAHKSSGLPTLSILLNEALGLGVVVVACQSGLALSGMTADSLDPRMTVGGPVGFLQELTADDRLLAI